MSRKLTDKEQQKIRAHVAAKPIDYIELYNEIYDHYASACENGSAEIETTLQKLDEQFDFSYVKKANDTVSQKTLQEVRSYYWKTFKDFWRWPQILTSIT